MDKKLIKGMLIRLSPAIIFCVWWQLSIWLSHVLGCTGNIKDTISCSAGGELSASFVAFGVFWAYILWLPALLFGLWKSGQFVQISRESAGRSSLSFTYTDAYKVSWKALAVWVAVSGAGASIILVALYPKKPNGILEWLALFGCWVPLWSAFCWLKERSSTKNA